MTRPLAILLALLLAAAVGSGCTGGGNDETREEPTATAAADGTSGPTAIDGSSARLTWDDLLAYIPAEPGPADYIMIVDYARLREAVGAERPTTGADEGALRAYVNALLLEEGDIGRPDVRVTGILSTPFFPIGLEEMRDNQGFTVTDADQTIEVGGLEISHQVVAGQVSLEAIRAAVLEDPDFGEFVQQFSYRDVPYFAWPGSPEGSDPSELRGQGALAVDGDVLYWAPSDAGVEAMIDAFVGRRSSLKGVEAVRTLFETIEDTGAYAAVLARVRIPLSIAAGLRAGLNASPEEVAEADAQFRREPLLLPYLAFAVGAGRDSSGYYIAVAALHEDQQAARTNAGLLEARINQGGTSLNDGLWRDKFTRIDVTSQGPILVGKLYTDNPAGWANISYRPETLLLYDDSAE